MDAILARVSFDASVTQTSRWNRAVMFEETLPRGGLIWLKPWTVLTASSIRFVSSRSPVSGLPQGTRS